MVSRNSFRSWRVPPWLLESTAVFLEVHDDPTHAKSDGANALRLDKLRAVLEQLLAVHAAVATK